MQQIKAEYHKFAENIFYTGRAFVPKHGGMVSNKIEAWCSCSFPKDDLMRSEQDYIIKKILY